LADATAQERATPDSDEAKAARHIQAHLRTLDSKLDLVIEMAQRQGERSGRLERALAALKRDVAELKGDVSLPENKVLTSHNEILTILHRLDRGPKGTDLQH
jgi:hypothetical protein